MIYVITTFPISGIDTVYRYSLGVDQAVCECFSNGRIEMFSGYNDYTRVRR